MEDATGAAKFAAFQLHKSVGITILLLVAFRLVWRFKRRPPNLTASGWERLSVQVVHGLFYVLLFALPVSGWMIVSTSSIVVPTMLYGIVSWPDLPLNDLSVAAKKNWNDVAEFIHVNLVNIIYGLFALHIAGALKHHFLNRDGSMARMAPGITPGKAHNPRLIGIGITTLLAFGLGLWWYPLGSGTAETTARKPTPSKMVNRSKPSQTAVLTEQAATVAGEIEADVLASAEEKSGAEIADTKVMPLSSWTIASGSTVRFSTSYVGEKINGSFGKFGGDITFSPDFLEKSHAEITIDMASVSSGDSQRDGTLKSADFFSVANFASGTFKTDRFRKTGNGYVASGTLRLKGMAVPVSLPFTLDIAGDKAVMRGIVSINRTAFRIGEGEFAATNEIPAQVKIDIRVNATRK